MREILKEKGNLAELEVVVKRWRKSLHDKSKEGMYVTKQRLMDEFKYTQKLCFNLHVQIVYVSLSHIRSLTHQQPCKSNLLPSVVPS